MNKRDFLKKLHEKIKYLEPEAEQSQEAVNLRRHHDETAATQNMHSLVYAKWLALRTLYEAVKNPQGQDLYRVINDWKEEQYYVPDDPHKIKRSLYNSPVKNCSEKITHYGVICKNNWLDVRGFLKAETAKQIIDGFMKALEKVKKEKANVVVKAVQEKDEKYEEKELEKKQHFELKSNKDNKLFRGVHWTANRLKTVQDRISLHHRHSGRR